MELIIDYNDFIIEFDNLLNNGKKLYDKNNSVTEKNLDSIKDEIKHWEKKYLNF